MSTRTKTGALAVVAVAVVAAGWALSAFIFPGEQRHAAIESLEVAQMSPVELVGVSDGIFVATYVGEQPRLVVNPGPQGSTDQTELVRYEETVRTFDVVRVIRGEGIAAGDRIEGHWETRLWFPRSETGSTKPIRDFGQDVRLVPGRTYLVMLARLLDESGTPRWSSYGGPDVAEISGDALTFLPPSGYLATLASRGAGTALPAAFSRTTIDDIVRIAANDDVLRAATAQQPTEGIHLTAREKRLQEFLELVPALGSREEAEAAATRLQLSGPAPEDAALCSKLEGYVRQTRGLDVRLRCTD